MKVRFEGTNLFLDGAIEGDTRDSVLLQLIRYNENVKQISWDMVKPFSATIRTRWIHTCYRTGINIPDEAIQDMLLTQCRSVVRQILDYHCVQWDERRGSNVAIRPDFRKLLAGVTEKQAVKLMNKLNYQSPSIVQYLPLKVLPCLIGIDMGDNEKKILELRIREGDHVPKAA